MGFPYIVIQPGTLGDLDDCRSVYRTPEPIESL
jgi:hypothetical protein